jgi:PAS domain S-box-containing protein
MECVIGGTSKYHALFDQPVVGVAAVDVETGQVLEVNPRCAEIFACSVDAMIGSDLAERAELDDRALLRAALAELGRGQGTGQTPDPGVELACRRLDGQAIRVRITGAAHGVTREVAACVVIIEDLTERWRAEVQLATYHQLLAESQRIAAVGITERERGPRSRGRDPRGVGGDRRWRGPRVELVGRGRGERRVVVEALQRGERVECECLSAPRYSGLAGRRNLSRRTGFRRTHLAHTVGRFVR